MVEAAEDYQGQQALISHAQFHLLARSSSAERRRSVSAPPSASDVDLLRNV